MNASRDGIRDAGTGIRPSAPRSRSKMATGNWQRKLTLSAIVTVRASSGKDRPSDELAASRPRWSPAESAQVYTQTADPLRDAQPSSRPSGWPVGTHAGLPVHEFVRGLSLTAKCGRNRHAVDTRRGWNPGKLGECGKQVPVRRRVAADAPGGDRTRPARDHRHADPSFVQVALDAAKPARALEEWRLGAPFPVRAVVAREDDERLSIESSRLQQVDQLPDIAVHPCDHRGKRGVRRRLRSISKRRTVRSGWLSIRRRVHEWLFGKASSERAQRVLGHAQLGMRNGVVQVEKKGRLSRAR